ncbi:transcription initiation factor IID, 18kD subunit-domain-containing protein [Aspergillus pseudoustus]|uniref:Transcription initiation factor TFIID subunit 13 n=1 Tax=Aspergillus pseudoustus TaxID=1810923 RepID=A0ABR4J9C4_9EURO
MPIINRSHRRRALFPVPPTTTTTTSPTLTSTPAAESARPRLIAVPSQQNPRTTAPFLRTVNNPGHVPRPLAPPWPFNPEDTSLIRAGYKPQFNPNKTNNTPSGETSTSIPTSDASSKGKKKMAEPRARAARHKGQMNFASELRLLLLAYGDPAPHPSFSSEPLPETVRVLDEIVTDFVLEMCHGAAQYANYSRRQKIKVDDFRFALRRDPNKLGRVQELLRMERELKEARKAFDQNDDQVGNLKDAGKKGLEDLGGEGAADGKKSKGKGKRTARRDSDATEDTTVKKRKTAS